MNDIILEMLAINILKLNKIGKIEFLFLKNILTGWAKAHILLFPYPLAEANGN
jgi:hypothetical protein